MSGLGQPEGCGILWRDSGRKNPTDARRTATTNPTGWWSWVKESRASSKVMPGHGITLSNIYTHDIMTCVCGRHADAWCVEYLDIMVVPY